MSALVKLCPRKRRTWCSSQARLISANCASLSDRRSPASISAARAGESGVTLMNAYALRASVASTGLAITPILFGLDAHLLRQPSPALDIVAQERTQFLRRAAARNLQAFDERCSLLA